MQVLRKLYNDLKEYYRYNDDVIIVKIEDIYNNIISVIISLDDYNITVCADFQRFKVNEKYFINKYLLKAEKYVIISILNERKRKRELKNDKFRFIAKIKE